MKILLIKLSYEDTLFNLIKPSKIYLHMINQICFNICEHVWGAFINKLLMSIFFLKIDLINLPQIYSHIIKSLMILYVNYFVCVCILFYFYNFVINQMVLQGHFI